MVACSKDDVNEAINLTAPTFTATFDEVATRVAIDNESLELSWSADDALSVFNATAANLKYVHKGEGKFSLEGEVVSGAALSQIYAVYPYAAETEVATDGVISLELPAVQNYVAGSFGEGANTMVAVAEKDSNVLSFKNVCGYLRLNLWGSGVVKSIKLVGNDGEILAGAATVEASASAAPAVTLTGSTAAITLDCGEGVALGATAEEATPFWFVVPAQVFEKGFTVIVTDVDGHEMVKSTTISREVKVNTVYTMDAIQVIPEVVGGEIIFDARFNADGTATDMGRYGLEIRTVAGANLTVAADPNISYNNVAKFAHTPNNDDNADGFYLVNYGGNEYFKANLEDGFTLEMVVKHNLYHGDFWVRPASGNTFGVLFKGLAQGFRVCSVMTDNTTNRYAGIVEHAVSIPYFNDYFHYAYVYDKDANKISLYRNGLLIAERTNPTFAVGDKLAIGGYPHENETIGQPFTGDVAMMRIYDTTMTAADAKKRSEVLGIEPPVSTINKPIFDAQFNADGSATNVGTYTGLSIEARRGTDDGLSAVAVSNFGYVANFGRGISNSQFTDGYYNISYANDATFQSKLSDGFSMEMVMSCDAYADGGAGYARVFGSESFGILRQDNGNNNLMAYWNYAGSPYWYSSQSGYVGGREQVNVTPEINKYLHVVYVYVPECRNIRVYVNGKYLKSAFPHPFYIGTRLVIGGYPMVVDGNEIITQPWNGNVAVARVYDEVFNDDQANTCYQASVSDIATLDAAMQ